MTVTAKMNAAAGWFKVAAAATLFAVLIADGGFPDSAGDITAFAALFALPVLGAVLHARAARPGRSAGPAYAALSIAASATLALLSVSRLGDCGGDGLGCEVAFLVLLVPYIVLEASSLVASRARRTR